MSCRAPVDLILRPRPQSKFVEDRQETAKGAEHKGVQ